MSKKETNVQDVDLLGGIFSPYSQPTQTTKPVSQPASDLLLDILGNGFGSDENKFSNEIASPVTFVQTETDENFLK